MTYLSGLKWQANLQTYNEDERKLLLVLSNEKYRWRTKERIATVSGLNEDKVDSILSELISKGTIRASISKKKNVIFGLCERID